MKDIIAISRIRKLKGPITINYNCDLFKKINATHRISLAANDFIEAQSEDLLVDPKILPGMLINRNNILYIVMKSRQFRIISLSDYFNNQMYYDTDVRPPLLNFNENKNGDFKLSLYGVELKRLPFKV